MEYGFRTNCKGCEDRLDCNLDKSKKLYNGKCYIHSIAQKINKKPIEIIRAIDRYVELSERYLNFYDEFNKLLSKMSECEKKYYFRYSYLDGIFCDESNTFIYIITAIHNTVFDIWRTDEMVRCMRCGEFIENNKRHNRRYCDSCKGYQKKSILTRKCAECGCDFTVDSTNKRSYLCDNCRFKQFEKEHPRFFYKDITCVDCGKTIKFVKSKNNKTCRCKDCYATYRKEKVKEHVRNYRIKQKM